MGWLESSRGFQEAGASRLRIAGFGWVKGFWMLNVALRIQGCKAPEL